MVQIPAQAAQPTSAMLGSTWDQRMERSWPATKTAGFRATVSLPTTRSAKFRNAAPLDEPRSFVLLLIPCLQPTALKAQHQAFLLEPQDVCQVRRPTQQSKGGMDVVDVVDVRVLVVAVVLVAVVVQVVDVNVEIVVVVTVVLELVTQQPRAIVEQHQALFS
mmetsp:Transcript_63739/g.205410  ORF Transcript_63739/g.205410 Transcript_63739/m.205410 type:complete len:162 (+) Transcript_63739:400-885(+)